MTRWQMIRWKKKMLLASAACVITALCMSFSSLFLFNTVSAQDELPDPETLDADTLVAGIEMYIDRRVRTEGLIVHICGETRDRKLKLRTDGGATIRIIPGGDIAEFESSLNDRRVVVTGLVSVKRLDETYIKKMEEQKALLCSTDHTPCIDEEWVDKQKKAGKADMVSARSIERMRKMLVEGGKGYVSVITIVADACEALPEKESDPAEGSHAE